jgi:hypothetical protein
VAQGAAGGVARLRERLPRRRPPVAKYTPVRDARWCTTPSALRSIFVLIRASYVHYIALARGRRSRTYQSSGARLR